MLRCHRPHGVPAAVGLTPPLAETTLLLAVQVRHFFKVGQERAQARAMLCAVAVQLAQQLPGYAAVLAPVVREHGAGGSLRGLKDMFDKWAHVASRACAQNK